MIGASMICKGCGDATHRRHPRSPSCMIDQPSSRSSRRAVSSFMNEPTGLSGWANAGSSRSTSVCVTSVTTALVDAAAPKRVAQRVLEHEADRTLRVADRVVDRHRGHLPIGDLRAAQDEADLGPVAVRDHDVPAGGDHVDDVRRRRAHGIVLVAERRVLAVADQRVAADRDDCDRLRSFGLPLAAAAHLAASAIDRLR